LGALLYAIIPCHLFVAYIIELAAAYQANGVLARNKRNETPNPSQGDKNREIRERWPAWQFIALAHAINSTLCLGITTFVVYQYIHHPLIGTLCEMHAIVVWLKNISYALANRDLRHVLLSRHSPPVLPGLYASCPYPRNITLRNLIYFWWAPTLVYQPVYPRSERIRWSFLAKRIAEVAGLSMFIWIASAQYAVPVLRNSLDKIQKHDIISVLERLMKLSTISLIIWLAGFFALFQSGLNALAEITRFGDREFYTDWWNSPSVGTYWRTWNKPVYSFMRRHIYAPLVARGWGSGLASFMVFLFSAVLHELLVGIPTHNVIGKPIAPHRFERHYS
jgi:diacylglycerol O-acyltransferase 1